MRRTTHSIVGLGVLSILAACSAGSSGDPATNKTATASTTMKTNDETVQCTAGTGTVAKSKYKTAFFGNLHQHTALSLDALTFGTRSSPAEAYQFAKGNRSLQIDGGQDAGARGPVVKINRPLDFLAITDHSEWLGVDVGCNDPSTQMYATQDCADVRSTQPVQQTLDFLKMNKFKTDLCGTGSATAAECATATHSGWQEEQMAAANAYEPCRFTSIIAYEWTSSINGDTNHRNVIFGSSTVPTVPLDSAAYPARTDLWAGLDQQCTGDCQVITPPHNSNLSAGVSLTLPGSPEEAGWMTKYQRLAEIYQHKGASECFYDPNDHSPKADKDCAFEYVSPGDKSDTPASYIRTALKNGMAYADAHAVNPLKLGIMASTDDHNAIAGMVAEDDYNGHLGRNDDTAEKRLAKETFQQYGPGGLAVVWAEQNTRASIFQALENRETYGTSGPRIQLRFYATTSETPCAAPFPQTIIDADVATPMGGTVGPSGLVGGKSPVFAIAAWPDTGNQPLPNGTSAPAMLAKVQIIKAHGTTTITEDPPVDVPFSAQGQCKPWRDPSFNADEQSFYYVRVLQEPTWRWSHFDCQGSTVAACQPGPNSLDTTIQERAWSSPIWYSPKAQANGS